MSLYLDVLAERIFWERHELRPDIVLFLPFVLPHDIRLPTQPSQAHRNKSLEKSSAHLNWSKKIRWLIWTMFNEVSKHFKTKVSP